MKKLLQALAVFLLLPHVGAAKEPLPFLGKNAVILFQGDSITDGGRWRTGSDFNHIMGQDYAYILAAEIGYRSPGRNLLFINRGIGGDRVPGLAARWQKDALEIRPSLLSILVGVNDALSTNAETVEEFESTYDHLLAQTIAALPGIKIVLGEPFVLPVGKHKQTYARDLAMVGKMREAVDRLGAKYHLPVIHYQQAFDAACKRAPADHWSWDGVHPTYAGHALMATEWLRTVDSFWGKSQ